MIRIIKNQNAGDALIKALTLKKPWVEIVDPAQGGRAVVESRKYQSTKAAKAFIKKQQTFDHWNRYEIVYK